MIMEPLLWFKKEKCSLRFHPSSPWLSRYIISNSFINMFCMHNPGSCAHTACYSNQSLISLTWQREWDREEQRHKKSLQFQTTYAHVHDCVCCSCTTARYFRLIWFREAMNKTCDNMHMKGRCWQRKTKTKKDARPVEKQAARSFSWTCSESLTLPISRGSTRSPSGDVSWPPLSLT